MNNGDTIKPTVTNNENLNAPVVNQNTNPVNNKPSHKKFYLKVIFVLFLVIVGLGYYIVNEKFLKKEEVEVKEEVKEEEKKDEVVVPPVEEEPPEEVKDDQRYVSEKDIDPDRYVVKVFEPRGFNKPNVNGTIVKKVSVYKNVEGLYTLEKEEGAEVAYNISMFSEDAEILDELRELSKGVKVLKYLLYKDNGIFVYDIENKKVKGLSVPTNATEYEFIRDTKSTHVDANAFALSYVDEDGDKVLFNINGNCEYFKGEYTEFSATNSYNYVEGIKTLEDGTSKIDLIRLDGGKVMMSLDYEGLTIIEVMENSRGELLYYLVGDGMSTMYKTYSIYNKKQKKIIGQLNRSEFGITNDNRILVVVNDKVKKYYDDANLASTYSSFGKVKQIIGNYVIYVNGNNELMLEDVNSSFSRKLIDMKDDYGYKWELSGFLAKDKVMTSMVNCDDGIYILINTLLTNNGGKGIEFYFNPNTKELKKYDLNSWPYTV